MIQQNMKHVYHKFRHVAGSVNILNNMIQGQIYTCMKIKTLKNNFIPCSFFILTWNRGKITLEQIWNKIISLFQLSSSPNQKSLIELLLTGAWQQDVKLILTSFFQSSRLPARMRQSSSTFGQQRVSRQPPSRPKSQ